MRISQCLLFTATTVGVFALPMGAMAEVTATPRIVTSIGRSATLSTEKMPPGSEMWALWVSLPAGKKVEVGAPKISSTWMDLEITLTGSTVSALMPGNAPNNECLLLGTDGQVNFAGQQITIRQGDGFACDFGTGGPYWEENQSAELYSRAQLNIGGPWRPGMYDTVDAYRRVGGESKALRVDSVAFRSVEKELRAAGMVTATTRIVTMPPGSDILMTDRYPTLRMLTRGELKWGVGPVNPDIPDLKSVFKLAPFNWIEWTRPQRVFLANDSDTPAEFIEWSVTPATASPP